MNPSQTETDAVRAASDQFYDALDEMANGNASAMADVWSHEDDVTTMHPIGGREEGWDAVKGSWEGVASMSEGGEVTRTGQLIRVTSDLAYELCTESASMTIAGDQLSLEGRATNVYRKENGEWKAVHHHADLDAQLAEKVANMGA
ncbi:YybH family protein [Haloarcula nitratireducens]|uniref:Nuclear transport factor 2 family protein n=1 Tax=Haloarcula nitratireducens TaxID=2487749 RepID=A0AAW4PHR9_9EURY|nr:nuclear transport factor 2 family protein [Halomicroarcula nitratireducens]MBX0298011.1 nuclear transport factor 2 family protein [Halomicroarcula nitratireducens]